MRFCDSLFLEQVYAAAMRRWSPILVFIAIPAALAWLLWEFSRIREPSYEGKSLTAWVQQYARCGPAPTRAGPAWVWSTDHAKWVEAAHALDVIGTNAIPFALHLAATHDSVGKRLLLKIPLPQTILDKLGCKDAYMHWTVAATECPQLADLIFMLVGRKATLPIEPVRRLLRGENPNTRITAAHILWYAVQWQVEEQAQPALPALAEALADPCSPVREAAYFSLRGISEGNAPPLKSSEHHQAYRAESARLLLPALVSLLQAPKADCVLVLKAIGDLGNSAHSATTNVWQFKHDSDPRVCLAARETITRIAGKN